MTRECPPADELVRLAEGRAGDSATQLRVHLDECDACRIATARAVTQRRQSTPVEPVAGRYRCVRRIGKGGMGEVHEAWDLVLERRVALKTLAPGGVDAEEAERRIARLVRESKAMARLRHPNVVAVHDAGVWHGEAYVVMELIDGPTLRAWLQIAQPRAAAEIVAMFVAAGQGLAAAHAHAIVHRDFKPDNVLVDEEGRAQVTDFGLARWVDDDVDRLTASSRVAAVIADPEGSVDMDASGSLTQTGVAVGTPAYMAPEQFRGHEVDARTDVFAFCVALFEALAGRRPFTGDSPRELLAAQRRGATDDALRARSVGKAIRDAVLAGLAYEPAARPRDMTMLLRRLQPAPSRSRLLVAVTAFAIAGLGIGGAMLGRAPKDDPCTQGDPLAAIWNGELAGSIDAPSWAPAQLDRWARTWTTAWTNACDAAPDDREAGLRRACLLGQRGAFAAVVDGLRAREIDAEGVSRGLPRIRDCGGDRDLSRLRPEPDDADAARRVEQLRVELDEILGLVNAGRARELDARADAALAEAQAIGFRPIEAETLYIRGHVQLANGRPLDARTTFVDAAQAASASGHDAASAMAWIALVELEADELHEIERGHEYADNVRAAIERLGVSSAVADLRLSLHFAYGKLLWQEGRMGEAKVEFRQGEAIAARIDPELRMSLLEGLAVVLEDEGAIDEAIAVYREIAEHRLTTLGDDHPLLAISYANLASAHSMLGHYDEALAFAQQATGVAERSVGTAHPDYGMALHNEGELLRELGRNDEALGRLHAALAIFEATAGVESYRYASALMHEAGVLQGMARYDDAISLMRRSLEIYDRQQSTHDTANAQMNLADVLREAGRADDALPYARVAADYFVEAGAESPEAAYALSVLGEIQLELGRTNEARATLERALGWYEKGGFLPYQYAVTAYLLARAIGDGARADELLAGAQELLADASPTWERRRREVATFRASRPIAPSG